MAKEAAEAMAVLGLEMLSKMLVVMMLVTFLLIILTIALYIYISFAFMAIAKKGKYKWPGIAWIPGIGPLLIASQLAKMHWWPLLLFIPLVISLALFSSFLPLLLIISFEATLVLILIAGISYILLCIYSVIWLWKTFKLLGRPGWWAIFYPFPILNLVFLVLLGIVAWGKQKSK
ncbi:MAG: hypothetical protein QW199_00490 [Candidatus Pacearchaeota archaeon]